MKNEFRNKLSRFINSTQFFWWMLGLSFVSVLVTMGELLAETPTSRLHYEQISWGLTCLFVVELVLRRWCADGWKNWLRGSWLELIAVVPVTRSFRMLRLLRLLRLISFGIKARKQKRLRFLGAFFSENITFLIIGVVILLSATLGIMILEGQNQDFCNVQQSFLWVLSTLTAGEPVFGAPVTMAGKIVSVMLMFTGISFFALFTGVITAYMVRVFRDDIEVDYSVVNHCDGHFVICGWNALTPRIVAELQCSSETANQDIVVISQNGNEHHLLPPRLRTISGIKGVMKYAFSNFMSHIPETWLLKGDTTSLEMLSKLKLEEAQGVIVLGEHLNGNHIQADARSVLTSLTVEKIPQKQALYSCVHLHDDLDKEKEALLRNLNVEDVVSPASFVGHLFAHSLMVGGLSTLLDDLFTSRSGHEFKVMNLTEVLGDKGATNVAALQQRLLQERGFILIGLGRGGRKEKAYTAFEVNPGAETEVFASDTVLVIRQVADFVPPTVASPDLRESTQVDSSELPPMTGILVCGWNNSVCELVWELLKKTKVAETPIYLLNELSEVPDFIRQRPEFQGERRLFWENGDYSSYKSLKQQMDRGISHVIVVPDILQPDLRQSDQDARTILTVLTLHNLYRAMKEEGPVPELKVSCELLADESAQDSENKFKVLEHLDEVKFAFSGMDYVAQLIAQSARIQGLGRVFSELLTANEGNEFQKINFPGELGEHATFGELAGYLLTQKQQILVGMCRKNREKTARIVTSAETICSPQDRFFVISR